jgi:hypothetical protein
MRVARRTLTGTTGRVAGRQGNLAHAYSGLGPRLGPRFRE